MNPLPDSVSAMLPFHAKWMSMAANQNTTTMAVFDHPR